MIGAFLVGAVTAAYSANRTEIQTRERAAAARREQDAWEEEHIRPAMSAEAWQAHLVERTRLREREDDIRRQERQHRELVEAEREKAAAIREAGRRRPSDLLLGFVAGELLRPMSDELTPFTSWDPHFFPEGDAQPDAEGLVWLYDAEGEKLLKVDPRRWRVVAAALELAYEATQTAGGALWTDEEATEKLEALQARVRAPWVWPEAEEVESATPCPGSGREVRSVKGGSASCPECQRLFLCPLGVLGDDDFAPSWVAHQHGEEAVPDEYKAAWQLPDHLPGKANLCPTA